MISPLFAALSSAHFMYHTRNALIIYWLNHLQLQVRWCAHSYSTCKVSELNELAVQGGRWYSTALVMSNGSILIMGGEAGAGGAANPTVEILPSGRIFVGE